MGIRLGIIGYGARGETHYEHVSQLDGITVVGAYDTGPARVRAAAEKGIRVFDSQKSLLACKDIDTVLVAVPNKLHGEVCIAAANAGKHVICETPAALSVLELDRMIAAAGRKGRVFTVYQDRRWDRDFHVVKKLLDSGELGRVYSVQCRLYGESGEMLGWRGQRHLGGGILYDRGAHLVDRLMWLLGYDDFKSVFCKTCRVKTVGAEDYAFLAFRLESGGHAQAEMGSFIPGELPHWTVLGDKAAAYVHAPAKGAGGLRVVLASAEGVKEYGDSLAGTQWGNPGDSWKEFYKNVQDTIERKAELAVQPWQVRKAMKVMEAALQSAETGKLVSLGD